MPTATGHEAHEAATRLTDTQRNVLQLISEGRPLGDYVPSYRPGARRGRGAFPTTIATRAAVQLAQMGLVTRGSNGEYELTQAGGLESHPHLSEASDELLEQIEAHQGVNEPTNRRVTLWRVANDNYIPDAAAFARKREDAETYFDNPGYGGSSLWRTRIDVPEKSVLNLYDERDPVERLARKFKIQNPGAINIEEWIPRTPRLQELLQEEGYDWVVVRDSFPEGAETWLWIGPFEREPELEPVPSSDGMREPTGSLELDLLEAFGEENGAPSGFVSKELGISTAKITTLAKELAEQGLLEDTGTAMKYMTRTGNWQFINKPKTEGGMMSRPGASTVWRTTRAGIEALNAAGRHKMNFRLEPDAFWG